MVLRPTFKHYPLRFLSLFVLLLLHLIACSSSNMEELEMPIDLPVIDSISTNEMEIVEGSFQLDRDSQAVVEAVTVSGNANNYTFNVQLSSPDSGCEQYADWWEVFAMDSTLIYRRILGHSHVNEQPFSRSGGPIDIDASTFVYIRGHMNNLGYGSLVFGGTVEDGFKAIELPIEFASDIAMQMPLPTNCAF